VFVFFGAAAQVEPPLALGPSVEDDLEDVDFEDDELAELVALMEDELAELVALREGELIVVEFVVRLMLLEDGIEDEDFTEEVMVTNEVFVVVVSRYRYAGWIAVNVNWPGIKSCIRELEDR
jgi:hypothetical protein